MEPELPQSGVLSKMFGIHATKVFNLHQILEKSSFLSYKLAKILATQGGNAKPLGSVRVSPLT